MREPISIVFDGDCAFCTKSLRLLRRLDRDGAMHLHDSHDSSIATRFPMLASADFDQAMFAVTADGQVFRGYFAFKALIRTLPAAWPLALLFMIPGANFIGPRVYAWVARNRRRMGCASDVCEMPSPPTPSPRTSGRAR